MTEEALFELLTLECRVDSYGDVYYYNAQGRTHRVHGPTVEYPDGYREWHIKGEKLTETEWQQVSSMENA